MHPALLHLAACMHRNLQERVSKKAKEEKLCRTHGSVEKRWRRPGSDFAPKRHRPRRDGEEGASRAGGESRTDEMALEGGTTAEAQVNERHHALRRRQGEAHPGDDRRESEDLAETSESPSGRDRGEKETSAANTRSSTLDAGHRRARPERGSTRDVTSPRMVRVTALVNWVPEHANLI